MMHAQWKTRHVNRVVIVTDADTPIIQIDITPHINVWFRN